MVSFDNYLKTKSLDNKKNNKNNKIIDDSYLVGVTIVESTQVNNVFVDDEPTRKRCFIIPERTFVVVVLSLYVFFGTLIASAAFMGLAFSSKPSDQAQYGVNGVLFTFLAVAGIVGLIAMRNDNAILLRRLSISFWVLTVLMLILNVTSYIIDIISKPETVKECQNQAIGGNGTTQIDLDCDKIVNYILIKEAFQLLFFEGISIYFTYTIACYSRKLLTKLKTLEFQSKFNNNNQNTDNNAPTYQIHTTNSSPPTSDDWKPPINNF